MDCKSIPFGGSWLDTNLTHHSGVMVADMPEARGLSFRQLFDGSDVKEENIGIPSMLTILSCVREERRERRLVVSAQTTYRSVAQFGSVHALGAWGRRFEPCHSDFVSADGFVMCHSLV